ncbi:flagellar biosynthetic protein FliR [Tepidiforma flava]|uniref:Flagellar biosynthetic protein FliR n=1 Tax=Tepidiforma flava TaxID=3004094 RepID=A0ABY7M4U4_9CHLR|nr:flagellar biosynthetic protein FliR [Tepidiforma flava]WBL34993.1 flagellar biosynthetic protein FliR [Tepidiforma flava]
MALDLSPVTTYTFLLILIRTSAMLVSSPLLSHRGIPAQAKIGFAVFTALVLTPITRLPGGQPPETFGRLVDDVLRETLFGLGISSALAMNIVFIGLQMASRVIGLQVGFGLGAVFDPITGTEFGVFDQFYALLVTLVFFAINGHHLVIQSLAETLQAVPPGTFDPFSLAPSGITSLVAGLTVTAVRIAMPVMAALLLTDVGMGIVAFAPSPRCRF